MKISYFIKKLSLPERIFAFEKVWLPGLLINLLAGLVSASAIGLVLFLFHRYLHFYIAVIFPILAGLVLGFCLVMSNTHGKCRNDIVMAVFGFLIGVYGYTFYQFLHFCEEHDRAERIANSATTYLSRFEELDLRDSKVASELIDIVGKDHTRLNETKLTFWGYLKFRSRVGKTAKEIDLLSLIKNRFKENDATNGIFWWLFYFFEAFCFSIFPVFFGFISTGGTFCEKCNEWTDSQTICSGFAEQPYRAKELALKGDMSNLILFARQVMPTDSLKSRMNQPFPGELNKFILEIKLSYCPKCKSTGYLSVKLGSELLVNNMPLTTAQIKGFESFIPSARE